MNVVGNVPRGKEKTMINTKVKISLGEPYDEIGQVPVIPICIPESNEIRALALWHYTRKGKLSKTKRGAGHLRTHRKHANPFHIPR